MGPALPLRATSLGHPLAGKLRKDLDSRTLQWRCTSCYLPRCHGAPVPYAGPVERLLRAVDPLLYALLVLAAFLPKDALRITPFAGRGHRHRAAVMTGLCAVWLAFAERAEPDEQEAEQAQEAEQEAEQEQEQEAEQEMTGQPRHQRT